LISEQRETLRAEVFALLGEKCFCCEESNMGFLTLDHKDDDGAAHREELAGMDIYRWALTAPEAVDVLQTSCFNCNCGRQLNGGICPHALLLKAPPKQPPALTKALKVAARKAERVERTKTYDDAIEKANVLIKQSWGLTFVEKLECERLIMSSLSDRGKSLDAIWPKHRNENVASSIEAICLQTPFVDGTWYIGQKPVARQAVIEYVAGVVADYICEFVGCSRATTPPEPTVFEWAKQGVPQPLGIELIKRGH
jgi:hypothetical protein